MSLEARIERFTKLLMDDSSFACPHCGKSHSVHDSDVTSSVVSYWGDDLHDFTCFECGADFVVKERVTRKFEAAKSADELN